MPDGTPPNNPTSNFQAGAQALTATRTGQSAGQFDVRRFPSNVGSQEIPHYVMFFITKRKTDISATEQENFTRDITAERNAGLRPFLSGRFADAATTLAGTIGGGALGNQLAQSIGQTGVAQAGTSFINAIFPNAGTAVAAAGTALATAGGATIGAAATAGTRATGGTEKITLKTCIALYLSGKPSASYTAVWQDKDIGLVAGMGEGLSSMATGAGQLFDGNFSGALDSMKSALQSAGGVASAAALSKAGQLPGGLGDVGALVQASQGFAVNPYKAQLFQNMGFRTFSFEYVFLPKNESEYNEVKEIIRLFKKYMHPTLSPGGVFLGYPAEFSMAYYYGASENSHLHRIGNCALTNVKVEYGGQDFITFRDTGGAPAEISLQLSFTELQLLTEKEFEEGESY